MRRCNYTSLCYFIKLPVAGWILKLEPWATEISIKTSKIQSCKISIGLQSRAQHYIDFHLKWLLQSTQAGIYISLLKSSLHEKGRRYPESQNRSSLRHNSIKLPWNRYFIQLDIFSNEFQSRSGFGSNFSGFVWKTFFFFSLYRIYSMKQFCWLNI